MSSARTLAHASQAERDRALILHEICKDIQYWQARDCSLAQALQNACSDPDAYVIRAGYDQRLAPIIKNLRGLSPRNLRELFVKWEKRPCPAVFLRNYQAGQGKVPRGLILEFKRRCTKEGATSTSKVIDDLQLEWAAGFCIEGLGTWQEWWQAQYPDAPLPPVAPDFPFANSTLYNYAPPKSLRTLGNLGLAEFGKIAAYTDRDIKKLRVAELYVLDDVRLDFVAIDTVTRKAVDLHAYLMRQVRTRCTVAMVLRPDNNITQSDVAELITRGLMAGGIGRDYVTHVLLERGTVAMSEANQVLLEGLTEGRVKIHRTGMVKGKTNAGAFEDVATGNWRGKSMIEGFFPTLHKQLQGLPGQRGADYSKQPASLGYGRPVVKDPASGAWTLVREAETLAQINHLAGGNTGLKLPLLTVREVNTAVRSAIDILHNGFDHTIEDFGEVLQAEVAPGVWMDKPKLPADLTVDQVKALNWRTRKRTPLEERAALEAAGDVPMPLPQAVAGQLLSEKRRLTVKRSGIFLKHNGATIKFWHEDSAVIETREGQEVLCKVDIENLDYIYVLEADGRFIEAIPRDGKAPFFDAKEASKEIERRRRANGRVLQTLDEIHKTDTQAELERTAHNAKIVNMINVFPDASPARSEPSPRSGGKEPASSPRPRSEPAAADSPMRFAQAEELSRIDADLAQQRTEHQARQAAGRELARQMPEVPVHFRQEQPKRRSLAELNAVMKKLNKGNEYD